MLVYQNTMFDRDYCIKSLSLENFGRTLRKVHFCISCTIMSRKSMKDSWVYAIIKVKMSLHIHPHSTLYMRAANALVSLHISAA